MIRLAALALVATSIFVPSTFVPRAAAQTRPVLQPGQEAAVLRMLRVDACELLGAQIDRDRIVARYACVAGARELVLRHPSASASRHRTERFALELDPADDALLAAVRRSVRAGEGEVAWSVPVPRTPRNTWAWLTWLLLGWLGAILIAEGRAATTSEVTSDRRAYAVLAVVALALLLVPEWGPLHEHLTFTGRSDCARMGCDRDRPGWLAPTYHAYRALLHLVPYGSKGLSALSAGLTIAALGAMLTWLRAVAPRAAPWAVLLAGLHPVVLHAAVAHSFWPLALLYLFAALWLAERSSARARLGLACALALAGTTSVAMVGPVAIVAARTAWRDRRDARRLVLLLIPLLFVAFHAVPFFSELGDAGERLAPRHFFDHALFDPRVSPAGFTLLVVAGAILGRRTGWAPMLALAVGSALPALGEPVEVGFPVAFLHGFPLVVLAAPVAGLACVSAPAKLRALPVVVIVLTFPTAIEAWQLEPPAVAREQRAIEQALAHLPPHRLLVVAPDILEPLCDRCGADPIEVRFPVGFYRARGFDARMARLDDDDLGAQLERHPDALFYVGTSLVSFLRAEIDDDVLADPRRPILRALPALEPVTTFHLSTESHPWSSMRIAADTTPRIELGFYRLGTNP